MMDARLEKDYLSVKEFSEISGIPASTLRHYDSEGVFCPAKRGVELENNYRFYAHMQIPAVNMIRVLTEMGVPLKEIKRLGHNRTPEKLLNILHAFRERIEVKIHFLHEVHSVINTYIDLLHEAIHAKHTEISVFEMPEKHIIIGSLNDFSDSEGFMGEFVRFCMETHEPELNMSFPIGGYFENMAAFLGEPSRPTRFFSLDPKGYESRDAGLYLVGYTHGYYGQTNALPLLLDDYAKMNGLECTGPVYNIYLTDEISVTDPSQYLLQASVAVTEKRRLSSQRHRRLTVS